MLAQRAELLTPEQITRVHEASLEILAETGLLVRNEKARKRLLHHGCKAGKADEIVTFPRTVVEEFRAMAPPSFTLHARDPERSVTIPRDVPVVTTASSAPNIMDPVTGEERWSTSDDIARIAHLVNELEGLDVFSISVLANDAPEGQFSLSRFYPALKNCAKPCRTSVIDRREGEQVLKLGSLIAGSREAFMARPFITFGYCAIVSPLTMDYDSTEMLMFYAEEGIPAYGTIAPIGGLSTPLTLPGMLALMNAEWLAACVLAQMSRAGTPQIYNFLPVFADMRDGAYAAGGIETGIMNAAVCQMARFYGVPAGGYLGLTNAKTSDAQAGFEKAMAPLIGVLSGVNFIVMGGLMDALMSFDFGQAVIDSEIAQMLKRAAVGMEFSEEALSLEEIKSVGPAGMFVGHPNTLARMHDATFLPELADRRPREKWLEEGGGETIHQRALRKARAILTQPNRSALPAEADKRIRAAFEGLVRGDSRPPEGWTPPKREKRRSRRRNTRRRGKAA
jgi:trimethylamine--corrinoid protein Co-methyltransferase